MATAPYLSGDEVAPYYTSVYYGAKNRRFHPLIESLIRVFRARRCRAIEKRVTGRRMVDVGCGRGLLPYLLRRRGWEAWGLEFSEMAATHAREVLGVPVHVGGIETAPFEHGSLDAVVFWHVLEHVADPVSALRRSRDLLGPGGLLVVAVPNYASLQARISGRRWFHLDVPRHYYHFRLPVLTRILEESGFTVESVHHFSLEQNPYGWVQSLMNMLGLRTNHLYEILKSESARDEKHPVARYPVQSLLTFLALGVVLPAATALFALETIVRRGGTVELYARRSSQDAPATGGRTT